ncbi:MAG: cytochrome C peroxidase [Saprospiraceae bacterium]|nr:cytochrome C peroxidase [Saprospiraceae bacterium]
MRPLKSINYYLSFSLVLMIGSAALTRHFFKSGNGFLCAIESQELVESNEYIELYAKKLVALEDSIQVILQKVGDNLETNQADILQSIKNARETLKSGDFFWRYVDPIQYRKFNGVLPVEWEVEVFEKWEPPYRREGGGLFLAEEVLTDENPNPEMIKALLQKSLFAVQAFKQDSNVNQLKDPAHFYFANRLFILNLAVIYTSGFENPDSSRILPELIKTLHHTRDIYAVYARVYPSFALPQEFMNLFYKMLFFVNSGQSSYSDFDHFTFIKDYVNPLYALNAQQINSLNLRSKSFNDYSLNNKALSIFSKDLYRAQENFSLFKRATLATKNDLKKLGEQLFHDPILSGNNLRSCASCHHPNQFFIDTNAVAPLAFDQKGILSRNAPSLINASINHLLMHDGLHLSLKDQLKAVHQKVDEMNADEETTMKELLSCPDYKKQLQLLVENSSDKKLSFEHVAEAIISYYTSFDTAVSEFDLAITGRTQVSKQVKKGFNLFMGKAACGTCHFAPHFNGIKPPYTGNEFEVLGVPVDTNFTALSADQGRYGVHPVPEMRNAFRTGALRNIGKTKPYMHNGLYKSLEEVIEFYNKGGGKGRGLQLDHQTLPEDQLQLTDLEKRQLVHFLESLNERLVINPLPPVLPECKSKELNQRISGGVY